MVDREQAARPGSSLLVALDQMGDERYEQIMVSLVTAIGEVELDPVRLVAAVERLGHTHRELADAIRDADPPYWQRQPVSFRG